MPHMNQFLMVIDECYLKPAYHKADKYLKNQPLVHPKDLTPIIQMPTEEHIIEKQSSLVRNGKQSQMKVLVRSTPTGVHLVNEFALPNTKWKCHIPKT